MKLRRMIFVTGLAFGCLAGELSTARAQQGEIIIRTAPPLPRSEPRVAPRPGYEWVPGYWRWDGRHYDWVAGHWERTRAGYVWQPARWERRPGGWVFVPGRWVSTTRPTPPPPPPAPPPPVTGGPGQGGPPHGHHGHDYWRRQGWAIIGDGWVRQGGQHEVIWIGPRAGRYSKLLLVADEGDLEMYDLIITFENGRTWSPDMRYWFREDQRSRTLILPNAPRGIRSVQVRHGAVPAGRARVQIWAR